MWVSKQNRVAALAAALAGVVVATQSPAAIIEFSEVPLANGTVLAGTELYAGYGIHFDGSATYAIDSRFTPNAGADTSGITTTIDDINMGIIFDAGATSVSFKGLAVNTDFYATVYDSNDVVLDSFFVAATPGTAYMSHTFSGVGTIARIEFHDNNQFIGVGQIDFTPVPEPTGLALGLAAILGLARRTRRA